MKKPDTISLFLIFLIGVFIASSSHDAYAQENSDQNKPVLAWGKAGFGGAAGKNMAGPSLIMNPQLDSSIGLFGLRYMRADDNAIRGFWGYIDGVSELSVTYGYSLNLNIVKLSASAGIGTFSGKERSPGSLEDNNFRVASFPVQGSITIQLLPFFGLGVMHSTSFNSHTTLSGNYIVLQIGKLR